MKKLSVFPVVALMVVASVPALAQHRSRERAEQEIRLIEQDSLEATVNLDWKFFERLLTPDWTGIDPLGRQVDKPELLSELRKATPRLQKANISMRLYDVSVRFLSDDVALLTGRVQTRGQTRPFVTRITEIYILRDGRWLNAASQSTLVKGT